MANALVNIIKAGDRDALNAYLLNQGIGGDQSGVSLNGQPNNALTALVRGQSMRPQAQHQMSSDGMQPLNTIRTSSGQYLTPGGDRSDAPVGFAAQNTPQFHGTPVDVMGQGKGYMQPDGSIVGVNAAGQRFSVNPAGTDAAQQAKIDQQLKRQAMQAQIADTLAQTNQRTSGKAATIPAGYRQTAEGNLEAIPGGPADLKLQGQFNQDTAALQNSQSSFDRLATAANELLTHPGLKGITGVRGAIYNIPGTDAADADAKLATLKSQVGFGVLQDMRNNSKTGGALGAVSDAEGKRLEANLAALDKAQSIDQFKQSLQKIIDYSDQAKTRMANAYNMRATQRPNIAQPMATANTQGANSVTAPDGSIHNFPNAASADAFRKAIGM